MMPPLHVQRAAEQLHALGPRALAEFLHELAEATGTAHEMQDMLGTWCRLDPAMVRAVLAQFAGGKSLPPLIQPVERAA